LAVEIADPSELTFRAGRLWFDNRPVDMVYNRLTDFALDDARHAAIASACVAGSVLVTPSPAHHRLIADKRNLAILADQDQLAAWGLAPEHLPALTAILPTRPVDAADWQSRKGLYFKPAAGFGSRAVYRGDKLTRRVWSEIMSHDYLVQPIAVPPRRRLGSEAGETVDARFDIRLFTFADRPILSAARLYRGQTTNFRTPGGGFAPVLVK
jgi:hypothetical protein